MAAGPDDGAAHRRPVARRVAVVDRRRVDPRPTRRPGAVVQRIIGLGQLHVDVDRGVAQPRLLADLRPRRLERDDDGRPGLHGLGSHHRDRVRLADRRPRRDRRHSVGPSPLRRPPRGGRRRAGGRRPPDRRPVTADAPAAWRRRVRVPRSPCARRRAPCRCSCSDWPSARGPSSTPPAPCGAAAGCRGGRSWRPSSSCWRSPTCRRSPATASSTRRSITTSTRRPRGRRPPPSSTPATPALASCSSPARSSAPSAGATPSTRRCPG